MENADKIRVEVAYARPDTQVIIAMELAANTTAEEAIHHSGVLETFPEIDLATNKIGVFGKLVKAGTPLRDGDRVEIYRALIADPKDVRRKRAAGDKTRD